MIHFERYDTKAYSFAINIGHWCVVFGRRFA